MKKNTFTLLLISIVYLLSVSSLLAGSVSGQILAPKRVKKLIVYLERENVPKLNKQAQKYMVSQKNTHFNPPLTIISIGDSVVWGNDETKEIDHNIFSLSSLNHFDLGLGEKGSKLSQSFNQSGVLNYYCSVHKEMGGKIVILPSRYYQFLEKPSKFEINNLPEGKWTLNAIVFHRRYKAEPIKLTIAKEIVYKLNLNIVKR